MAGSERSVPVPCDIAARVELDDGASFHLSTIRSLWGVEERFRTGHVAPSARRRASASFAANAACSGVASP
jgi:hypothetical protein